MQAMKIRNISGGIILSLILGLSLCAQSRPELIKSIDHITTKDQLSEWLNYYYVHPRPDLVVSAMQFMSTQGKLQEANAKTPYCVFLANVFAANAAKVETWFGELRSGPEDQKSALALVLWMTDTKGSQSLLKSLSKEGSPTFQEYVTELAADDHRPDFLHDEINSPGFLDALWVSFLVSGDERYVKRVISALPLINDSDTGRMLIGGAAKWSLASNAFQHPKVMQICEAQLKELPDQQRAALAEVIQSAREQKK
jgi:hypothetical protein